MVLSNALHRTRFLVLLVLLMQLLLHQVKAQNPPPCGLVAQIGTEFIASGSLVACYMNPATCALAIELNTAATRQLTTTTLYGTCKITTWLSDGTVHAIVEAIGEDADKVIKDISNQLKEVNPRGLHYYLTR